MWKLLVVAAFVARLAYAAPDTVVVDSVALAPVVLTREGLIRAVFDTNRTLEAARHAFEAAQAQVSAAGSLPDPMVMVDVAPASVVSKHGFGIGVSVSQALPWPGKREIAKRAEEAKATFARLDAERAKLALAALASELFDDWSLVHRALALDEAQRGLLLDFQQVATSRYAAGNGALQDPLQAEVELARSLERKAELEARRDVLGARINRLLGRPFDTPIPPPEDRLVEAKDAADDAERPDVRAAAARVSVAERESEGAQAAFRPDFEVTTSYSTMWEDPTHRWMVGVGVNVPLWQGRLEAERRAATERIAQASALVDEARAEARLEVEEARIRVRQAETALVIHEDRLLPAARDQVDAARAGFIAGANTFSTLIDAARAEYAARLGYETTRVELSKARAALLVAQGQMPVAISDSTAVSEAGARTDGVR